MNFTLSIYFINIIVVENIYVDKRSNHSSRAISNQLQAKRGISMPASRTGMPVVQRTIIKITRSGIGVLWGNDFEIEIEDLWEYVKIDRRWDDKIDLSDGDDFWVYVSDVVAAVRDAVEYSEMKVADKKSLAKILHTLTGEELMDYTGGELDKKEEKGATTTGVTRKPLGNKMMIRRAPGKMAPPNARFKVPSKAPVKNVDAEESDVEEPIVKEPDVEKETAKRPYKKPRTTKAPVKVNGKEKEKSTDKKKPPRPLTLTNLTDFPTSIIPGTAYGHDKRNARVFLTTAPLPVLNLLGESGRLIKSKEFDGTGKEGEKADLRYIDFVKTMKTIFDQLQVETDTQKNAIKALKILNEFLVIIHDFKYRVRYAELTQDADTKKSREAEIQKCIQETQVLNLLLDEIYKEEDPGNRAALIKKTTDFFDLAFGFGVLDSVHPGRMFAGPLDVNHVNFDSLYTQQDYKVIFKQTEEIRKTVNAQHHTSDFGGPYFSKSLLGVAKHAVKNNYGNEEETSGDETDFLKSHGIGRSHVEKLRLLAKAKKEDFDDEFSDYLADSESEGEEEKRKYIPGKGDTIGEFSRKKQPFLFSAALFEKAMNEGILLRQFELNKHKIPRETRLREMVKKKREKEVSVFKFMASGHKSEIADKFNRQLENINQMIANCQALIKDGEAIKISGSGKSAKEIKVTNVTQLWKAWSRTDFIKDLHVSEDPSLEEVMEALEVLKSRLQTIGFDEFYQKHSGSKKKYAYDRKHKFFGVGFFPEETESSDSYESSDSDEKDGKDKRDKKRKRSKSSSEEESVSSREESSEENWEEGQDESMGKSEEEEIVKAKFASVDDWAASHGGRPAYGDGSMNNCLIYAIAHALDVELPDKLVRAIRDSLVRADLAGVDAKGYLPGYGRVVDLIAQHILSGLLDSGERLSPVTIRIDSVIKNIAPVIVGEGGTVYIFHDGNHFWGLK